jgi:hypothetical protein
VRTRTLQGTLAPCCLPRIPHAGPRVFPPGGPPQPPWPGGAKKFGARFTPRGSFDTLYLCCDALTAMPEVGAAIRPPGGPVVSAKSNPLVLSQIDGSLDAVLDLTDRPSSGCRVRVKQNSLGVGDWLWIGLRGFWRRQRKLSGRISAMQSSSSKNPGVGTILAVFTDHLASFPPSFVEVI